MAIRTCVVNETRGMALDIDAYARTTAPLRWDDLDLDAFRDRPLSPDALRCIRYMSDVETHTVCYLRDLLVTPSHADPEVTVFMTMWNFEEHFHGVALDAVLDAHGIPTGPDHTRALRKGLGIKDRVEPIKQSIVANLIGTDFIATHMTWGTINEWSAHAAYTRMAQKEDHPVLTELLSRIAKQETRHIAFYNSQARLRLAASRKARAITKYSLTNVWTIVGGTIMPKPEIHHMLNYLFGGGEGIEMVRKVDAKVDTLPGMAGLHLVEGQLRKYGVAIG